VTFDRVEMLICYLKTKYPLETYVKRGLYYMAVVLAGLGYLPRR